MQWDYIGKARGATDYSNSTLLPASHFPLAFTSPSSLGGPQCSLENKLLPAQYPMPAQAAPRHARLALGGRKLDPNTSQSPVAAACSSAPPIVSSRPHAMIALPVSLSAHTPTTNPTRMSTTISPTTLSSSSARDIELRDQKEGEGEPGDSPECKAGDGGVGVARC